VSFETYITLQEASQRYNLDTQLLTHFVEDGKIRGGRFNGTFVLREDDVKEAQRLDRTQFAHLDGHEIHLSEASRKYEIPMSSLSRWASQGKIAVIRLEKNRKILNEADIAYARALIDAQGGHKRGRSVFT
jgi:predicted site-specific integrase-resolvase